MYDHQPIVGRKRMLITAVGQSGPGATLTHIADYIPSVTAVDLLNWSMVTEII